MSKRPHVSNDAKAAPPQQKRRTWEDHVHDMQKTLKECADAGILFQITINSNTKEIYKNFSPLLRKKIASAHREGCIKLNDARGKEERLHLQELWNESNKHLGVCIGFKEKSDDLFIVLRKIMDWSSEEFINHLKVLLESIDKDPLQQMKFVVAIATKMIQELCDNSKLEALCAEYPKVICERSEGGSTLLHIAAASGNNEALEILKCKALESLDRGESFAGCLGIHNDSGCDVLQACLIEGHYPDRMIISRTLKFLLQHMEKPQKSLNGVQSLLEEAESKENQPRILAFCQFIKDIDVPQILRDL